MTNTYTRREIAARYGMTPGGVRQWLINEGIDRIGLDQHSGEALYAAEVIDRARSEMKGRGRRREAGHTIRHESDIDNAEHDS